MSDTAALPEPLIKLLRTFCDVNAVEMLDRLRDRLAAGEVAQSYVEPMRAALQEAIAQRSVTPEQYEALTGDEDYPTTEAVTARLQEIHDALSPDARGAIPSS